MAKYRKKPIMIEAEQTMINQPLPFLGEARYRDHSVYGGEVFDIAHRTWDGFKMGDWIIKGVMGEFYPCEPHVFEETYELVAEKEGE